MLPPSGGTNQAPVITWNAGTNGGFPSYWTYPNGLVNRGSLKIRGVNNIPDTGLLPLSGGTVTGVLTVNAGTVDPPLQTQAGGQIWASGVRNDGYYAIRDESGSLTALTILPAGGGGGIQALTAATFSNGANLGSQIGASNTDFTKHIGLHVTGGYGIGVTSLRINYVVGAGGAAHVFMSNGADRLSVSDTLLTAAVSARFNSTIGFNNTAPIAKPTVSGAKGSNAALASLLTALAAYGFVTDSRTA